MNSISIKLHDYCSNHVFLQTLHDLMLVNIWFGWLKYGHFFFYKSTKESAL